MATKTKSKPKARARKPKQGFLPGMRPKSIPALDAATETYYEAMTDRLPYTKAEVEAKDSLLEKMIEQGVDRYETPEGLVATRTSSSQVAVKPKKEPKEPKPSENGDGEK